MSENLSASQAFIPSAPSPQDEYVDKVEAAKRIGRSERTVLEMVSAGTIRAVKQRNPQTGQTRMMLLAEDVDRVVRDRQNPVLVPRPLVEDKAPSRRADTPQQASAAESQPFTVPISPAPFFTVSEAAEYLRVPAGLLAELIEAGKLPALDAKHRKAGRWLVCRRDLDALQGERISA